MNIEKIIEEFEKIAVKKFREQMNKESTLSMAKLLRFHESLKDWLRITLTQLEEEVRESAKRDFLEYLNKWKALTDQGSKEIDRIHKSLTPPQDTTNE